jgi:beta-lactamase class A
MTNKTIKQNKKPSEVILHLALIGFALFSGWHLWHEHSESNCRNSYSFVNKRFACFEDHTVDKKSYIELKARLVDYIQEEKEAGRIDVVSVYFRDLESGPTMGIDERIDYAPASLLKLPIALVVMTLHEANELDLSQKLAYLDTRIPEMQNSKRANAPLYTIEDLLFKSLAHSDNLATIVLSNYINSIDNNQNLISVIYRDLGVLLVDDRDDSSVNTKGYSSIFTMLYNSSLLTSVSSEKILGILSQSISNGGLRQGVPQNIKVSHKFGERIIAENEKQLHDCGIVYYPENPYLLCIMTKGRELEKLQGVITTISTRVYQEFNSRRLE